MNAFSLETSPSATVERGKKEATPRLCASTGESAAPLCLRWPCGLSDVWGDLCFLAWRRRLVRFRCPGGVRFVDAASSLCNKVLLAFFHFVVATSGAGGKPGEWGLVRSGDLVGAPDLPALFFLTGYGGSFDAADLVSVTEPTKL
jgi:hypothetical protein